MRKMKVWINGRFIDINKAKVSIFDRGFLYGDSAFETMRSYDGVVFGLDAHIDRLFRSLKIIGIKPPHSKACLKSVIYKILKTNRLKDAYIRLTVTRGEGRFGITQKDRFTPSVVIIAKSFEGYPARMYSRGISAKIVDIRQNELSPLSGIKSGNFLPYILARFEAKNGEADEAILINTKGHVAEAATSNVFLVKGNVLITPSLDSGVLPGITRYTVLGLARQLGMRVQERRVLPRELYAADEVFLTNSLAEIIPVTRIDSRKIGNGRPGPAAKLLHTAYKLTL